MLEYDRIDVSEGIDFNKTRMSLLFVITGAFLEQYHNIQS